MLCQCQYSGSAPDFWLWQTVPPTSFLLAHFIRLGREDKFNPFGLCQQQALPFGKTPYFYNSRVEDLNERIFFRWPTDSKHDLSRIAPRTWQQDETLPGGKKRTFIRVDWKASEYMKQLASWDDEQMETGVWCTFKKRFTHHCRLYLTPDFRFEMTHSEQTKNYDDLHGLDNSSPLYTHRQKGLWAFARPSKVAEWDKCTPKYRSVQDTLQGKKEYTIILFSQSQDNFCPIWNLIIEEGNTLLCSPFGISAPQGRLH